MRKPPQKSGTRHVDAVEALVDLAHERLELCAIGDGLALRRGPGADARAARARGEVVVGLRLGHALDRSSQAHLPVQLEPAEDGGRRRAARPAAAP